MASGTGNLPNQSMSFSPFAILTAEEMNDLVENIESLADGTGIGDEAIGTSALGQSVVQSDKLVENFLRGRYQNDSTNSAPTGQTIQSGFGFVNGSASVSLGDAVTFPVAFSSVNIVVATFVGFRASNDPTSLTANSLAAAERTVITVHSTSNTGFSITLRNNNDSNFVAGNRYSYCWMAIGVV